MKTNRILTLCAGLLLAGGLLAQTKPTQDPAMQRQKTADRHEQALKELGLSDEQRTKVVAAEETYNNVLAEVRAAGLPAEDAARREAAVRENLFAEVKSILDEEQFAAYTGLIEARSRNATPQRLSAPAE